MQQNRTKIVCTIGPATETTAKIVELIEAGMDTARINFSHGTEKSNLQIINNIQRAEEKTGKRIGIMLDLQGPKIRIGEVPEKGIKLKKDQVFVLTTKKIIGKQNKTETVIPTEYQNLHRDLKEKDIILINDGLIECQVEKIKGQAIYCKVINEGLVTSRRGMNFPTTSISQPALTSKDKKDLKFGLKHNIDFVALSFVKSEKDIKELRELVEKENSSAKLIAKIERHEAVKNLEAIIKEADIVMVARGDLACDIPPEQVPIVQKHIIKIANKFGKSVITATQVLYSMIKNPMPTRAEISDAANAIFDHTDAIMLSNETAVGKYPVEATEMLNRVAIVAEKEMQKNREHLEFSQLENNYKKACELAIKKSAKHLIVITNETEPVQQIAKHRPQIHLIAITENEKTAHQLTLVWGINDVFIHKFNAFFLHYRLRKFLLDKNLAKKNEKAILIKNGRIKKLTI